MNGNEIVAELFRLRDAQYAAFQAKLIPTVPPERMIGVRTPDIRALAKRISREKDTGLFLAGLPHRYFDEDQLHAFVISLEKDFDACVLQVEAFLPYVDNWATCDQLSPVIFKKWAEKLIPHIQRWMGSDKPYIVRFAIGMLLQHFLDERFSLEYADTVAALRSEEYYINMMRAWYFATALAKQYDAILPYLEDKRLDSWTHRKAIQKSIESYRITDEQKQYLKTLKT